MKRYTENKRNAIKTNNIQKFLQDFTKKYSAKYLQTKTSRQRMRSKITEKAYEMKTLHITKEVEWIQ